jgi:hypothetical protein
MFECDGHTKKGNPCVQVSSKTQQLCDNEPVHVKPVFPPVTIKVPRVLAELDVEIDVDSTIKLPEPALEIKRIKKRLKLVQCMLIQNTKKLFLKGFVRKNIEFSTIKCSDFKGTCGDIHHCTVDIPFSCVTPVKFNVGKPEEVKPSISKEFEYLKSSKLFGPEFAEKDQLMAGDFSEFNQVTVEHFNELPFCELVKSEITEFDELLGRSRPKDIELPFEEKVFRTIEEKMVIHLTLKVLQDQQVHIPHKWHREQDGEDYAD